MEPLSAVIFRELNNLVLQKADGNRLIEHNLEQGLGNEAIVRQTLTSFLPAKYGVTKGKLLNTAGEMSRHCDLIIYDAIQCPRLFSDDHMNQILPAEGVYAVWEIKTTLTKETLREAFENLQSVYAIRPRPKNCSATNKMVTFRPPQLGVLALGSPLKLTTIAKHYVAFDKDYSANWSFTDLTPASAGYRERTGDMHLVSEVVVLGLGIAHAMLAGWLTYREYRDFTLAVFLTSLAQELGSMELPAPNLVSYFNHIMADQLNEMPTIADRPRLT